MVLLGCHHVPLYGMLNLSAQASQKFSDACPVGAYQDPEFSMAACRRSPAASQSRGQPSSTQFVQVRRSTRALPASSAVHDLF